MRFAFVLVVLSMLAAAPSAAGAESRKGEAREAKRLFEAAGTTSLVAQRPASVEEVAAIAAAAEGISIEEARAAVAGLDAAIALDGASDAAATTAAAAVYCTWAEWDHHRGIFPYHRWIVGHTYWCYHYGGDITYRASSTSARVDGVCSGSGERDWKVSGGAGYSWGVVHHEADFSCATPWWYPLNDTLWMEPAFNSYGNTSMTRTS
jgi:hypothetical protein